MERCGLKRSLILRMVSKRRESPSMARLAARLTAVVVFPTPPFRFAMAIILVMKSFEILSTRKTPVMFHVEHSRLRKRASFGFLRNADAPCPEKLVIPQDDHPAILRLYPEIRHGKTGGIQPAFIPSVYNLRNPESPPPPFKGHGFLCTLVFIPRLDFCFIILHTLVHRLHKFPPSGKASIQFLKYTGRKAQ